MSRVTKRQLANDLEKLYGRPASFHKINTFSYDICNPANSQPDSPSIHHTMHAVVSLTITHNVCHTKSTNNVI